MTQVVKIDAPKYTIEKATIDDEKEAVEFLKATFFKVYPFYAITK